MATIHLQRRWRLNADLKLKKLRKLSKKTWHIYRANDCLVEQAKSQVGKLCALAFLGRYDEALETGRWASQFLEAHAEWRPLATSPNLVSSQLT